MAQGRPRDLHKEQLWRHLIQLWRESGLSVSQFCQQHHLPVPLFYSWRRRLLARTVPPLSFVPVQLQPDPVPASTLSLEVVLGNGRSLRVPPGFDEHALRRLLAVLEESPSC